MEEMELKIIHKRGYGGTWYYFVYKNGVALKNFYWKCSALLYCRIIAREFVSNVKEEDIVFQQKYKR
jgi:hypothetical protein